MSTEPDTVAPSQTHPFQAEVSELLRLMVNAVYSEADVFLRELISNASDACDRLRYEAIAKPALLATGGHPGGRRYRYRHGPAGADRQPRHRRAVGHARVREPPRRGQGRLRAHRSVRR